jgi:hypothetical protein
MLFYVRARTRRLKDGVMMSEQFQVDIRNPVNIVALLEAAEPGGTVTVNFGEPPKKLGENPGPKSSVTIRVSSAVTTYTGGKKVRHVEGVDGLGRSIRVRAYLRYRTAILEIL